MSSLSAIPPAARWTRSVGFGLMRMAPTLILVAIMLALWEATTRLFHLPTFVLPAPSTVASVLIFRQDELFTAARVTAEEVLFGFILSGVVGIAVALVVARFDAFGRALYPLVVLFQTVPKIALAPLFILWFGYDLQPKVALIVVIAFFPVALDMLAGLQSVDQNLVILMRSVGATRTEILRRVQIPNSLPQLMSGLKIAVTLSVIGAIVGEFAGASAGLGYMIQFASTQMEAPLVFAALVEVSLLGLVFFYAVEAIEHRFITWVPRTIDEHGPARSG
ncbi:MAG: ABC transporter permease [Xanthobacteraceae bacterium]